MLEGEQDYEARPQERIGVLTGRWRIETKFWLSIGNWRRLFMFMVVKGKECEGKLRRGIMVNLVSEMIGLVFC